MLHRTNQPQWSTRASRFIGSCLTCALMIAFLLFPMSASAHTARNASGGPSFHVNAGFDARYRDGNWIPVQVTLSNSGTDFTGAISVNVPPPYLGGGSANPQAVYQAPISLANGAQKQVMLYVPLYFGSQGSTQTFSVDLLNSDGQKVSSQQTTVRTLGSDDIFVGVLSDQSAGFSPLSSLKLPNQTASIVVEQLDATTMPTVAAVLQNFDLIVLDNFTTSSLNHEQLIALQNWVNQGGALIVVGGPEWRQTLSPLPATLLPVAVTGTADIAAGTALLPVGGPTKGGPEHSKTSDSVHTPVTVSTGTPLSGSSVVLASGTTPLIVQSNLGQGTICYLAFDPTLEPILSWPSAGVLWKGLLLRTLGDQLVVPGSTLGLGSSMKFSPYRGSIDSLLQAFLPNTFPSILFILILLLSYIVVLGPVRFLLVRRLKRRDWSWRITLIAILVFSLLSYGLALQQKGMAVLSDSASILQLSRPGTAGSANSSAHTTTYLGVFVPSQGNFQVHMDGSNLVQPSSNQFQYYSGQQSPQLTTITASPHGTDVNLQGVNIWTFHTVVSQQDSAVHGGIVSQLTLKNGTLTGTVTNTLPHALSDVYVLIGNSYTSLGSLPANWTKQVNLAVDSSINNAGLPFAEQIASRTGQNIGPYINASQLHNEQQRHLAMLIALSGQYTGYYCGPGGPCFQSAPIPIYKGAILGRAIINSPAIGNGFVYSGSSGVFLSGGGPLLFNERDPLLVPGAPATLIGWMDTSTDTANGITINGYQSAGLQETLVQAPLDVNLAGSVNLGSTFVSSQIVDIESQGNNIQEQLTGVYTMTTGSMTFEFTLPNVTRLYADSATISEPANIASYAQRVGLPSTVLVDANHLHASLYNWQTSSWKSIDMSNFSYSTNSITPYIGPGGRILLQVANQDSSVGTIVFGKPSLQLQGTVA
jgi:uncharacterized membrane protein YhaH (DUF805 family)